MMKYATEFDVGDIIRYSHKRNFQNSYYLIMEVGKRSYMILCFEDGKQYPLDKSDYYHYEKVS